MGSSVNVHLDIAWNEALRTCCMISLLQQGDAMFTQGLGVTVNDDVIALVYYFYQTAWLLQSDPWINIKGQIKIPYKEICLKTFEEKTGFKVRYTSTWLAENLASLGCVTVLH